MNKSAEQTLNDAGLASSLWGQRIIVNEILNHPSTEWQLLADTWGDCAFGMLHGRVLRMPMIGVLRHDRPPDDPRLLGLGKQFARAMGLHRKYVEAAEILIAIRDRAAEILAELDINDGADIVPLGYDIVDAEIEKYNNRDQRDPFTRKAEDMRNGLMDLLWREAFSSEPDFVEEQCECGNGNWKGQTWSSMHGGDPYWPKCIKCHGLRTIKRDKKTGESVDVKMRTAAWLDYPGIGVVGRIEGCAKRGWDRVEYMAIESREGSSSTPISNWYDENDSAFIGKQSECYSRFGARLFPDVVRVLKLHLAKERWLDMKEIRVMHQRVSIEELEGYLVPEPEVEEANPPNKSPIAKAIHEENNG